jgi:hypothetical protein
MARSSASRTDTSLMAIVPLSECRIPTLISFPLTPGEDSADEPPLAASPPLPQPAATIDSAVSPATIQYFVPTPRKTAPL